MTSYIQTCPPMWKFAHGHALVSQTFCLEWRLFTFNKSNSPSHQSNQCTQTWFRILIVGYWKGFVSKKCHVVVWEFRYIDGKVGGKHSVMLIVTHMRFRKSKSYVDTRCFTVGKTMKSFRSDMSTYVTSCTRTRPRKSKWCTVISWSVILIVVVSPRGQLFFVVSRSSWMVFIFYGGYAHVFTETYGWGKPRSMSGQIYGGWVELGRNRSRMSIIT